MGLSGRVSLGMGPAGLGGRWEGGGGVGTGGALGSQINFDARQRGVWVRGGAQVGAAAGGAVFTPVLTGVWLLARLVEYPGLCWTSLLHGFSFVIYFQYVKAEFSRVGLCMSLHIV